MSTDSAAPFDPALPYTLAGSVSLRPEPFGALVYDYATRRLSFLKTPLLVNVVRELENHPDAASTLVAVDVPAADHDRYLHALAGLCESGTIALRTAS
ncbi:mycofactocin biosynthesis chaperone MftB [Nocardia noduli]|uniref:mycofactocin biosynthesis chaperone MftB n=1 Tax=Nocardia noduli TaxID=2815722 RepID=UPI001C234DB2|nr:mycofactocin biosynthesis chaperone MftB [Nocardia noduli]